ncbi:hypothetical protein [Craurococcus roseus]|uniref:hypothetical protein n=1 Tax=Craurococcus roseus TaxID=77585 RepID=UPI0031D38A83
MALRTVVASLALAASTAACTVQPAVPLAAHVPAPAVVVAPPPPLVVGPVLHRPHPGRGWGHGRRHHHH